MPYADYFTHPDLKLVDGELRRGVVMRGVFARRPIPADTFLLTWPGKWMTMAQFDDLVNAFDVSRYAIGMKDVSLCPPLSVHGTPDTKAYAGFINEPAASDTSNVDTVLLGGTYGLVIVTTRNIRAGEELVYHYGNNLETGYDRRRYVFDYEREVVRRCAPYTTCLPDTCSTEEIYDDKNFPKDVYVNPPTRAKGRCALVRDLAWNEATLKMLLRTALTREAPPMPHRSVATTDLRRVAEAFVDGTPATRRRLRPLFGKKKGRE